MEDFAIMRSQPNMIVVAPANVAQAAASLWATLDLPGPVYYRVGKYEGPAIAELEGQVRRGRIKLVQHWSDVGILATGDIAAEAWQAGKRIAFEGFSRGIAVVGCLSPVTRGHCVAPLADVPVAFTAESHYLNGGVTSLMAEVITEEGLACRLFRFGLPVVPETSSESQGFMQRHTGLDATSLAERVFVLAAQRQSGERTRSGRDPTRPS